MRIGELSRRTGASVRALRYYEQQGLLSATRTPGGHREYAASDVDKVVLVQRLISAGVPSAKMAEIFPCVFGGHSKPTTEVVADLCEERERINGMIDDLLASRAILDDMITDAREAANA
ncbi:DNA-binding transcriptional regulator, MerR family [Saccharopolyspora antimicrobica]|uniref:DNA-binding transcriptional MerR regulator n=1 Tax=Saccharopolyspora antimicrobica TaxID=455193 RepID=A0A1I4QE85_9PSEU|nr:MerR family transcriptional regulator [Saccharopolyspora antimicrobica]RKT84897.1 DNA-binding transcriptional MerR regulator [Saccharopolyspora antimicrobica]SFM38369.1 DNA-binding transcriptional regulator, MerR family [Saccharopolyspora antimicrobica]